MQVKIAETELRTGPEVLAHEAGPPERLHEGVPVGTTDPFAPVMVEVNVMFCPPAVTDCDATIPIEG